MLVIRLARTGRRNQPKFRLTVAEHSKPVDGKVVEVVGHYNPTVLDKAQAFVVNKEAVEAWLAKGAKPSNTVSRLLNTYAGFSLAVEQRPARKPKKAPAEPAAPAPAAVEEAPAEQPAVADEEAPATEADVAPATETTSEEPVSTEEVATETPEAASDEPADVVVEEIPDQPAEQESNSEQAPEA